MYPRILCMLIVSILAVDTIFAQSTASESATVSATVVAAVGISKNQNLSFGDVARNTSSTIAVTDGAAAKFTVTGEPNKDITIALTDPSTLSDGSNTLTFSSDAKYNTSDNAGAASALTSGSTISLSASGNLYVYVGGTVTAGASQVTGAYSGTFTVEVDY